MILEGCHGPDIFNWVLTRMKSEHHHIFFLSNKVHNSLSKKFSNQTGKYDTRTSKGFFQRVSSSDRVLIVNISQLIYWKNIDNSQNG